MYTMTVSSTSRWDGAFVLNETLLIPIHSNVNIYMLLDFGPVMHLCHVYTSFGVDHSISTPSARFERICMKATTKYVRQQQRPRQPKHWTFEFDYDFQPAISLKYVSKT